MGGNSQGGRWREATREPLECLSEEQLVETHQPTPVRLQNEGFNKAILKGFL